MSCVLVGWLTNWLRTFDCLHRFDLCVPWTSTRTRMCVYECEFIILPLEALSHSHTRSVCYFWFIIFFLSPIASIQFDWNLSSILISIQYFSIRFRYLIHVIESCSIVPSRLLRVGASADVGVSHSYECQTIEVDADVCEMYGRSTITVAKTTTAAMMTMAATTVATVIEYIFRLSIFRRQFILSICSAFAHCECNVVVGVRVLVLIYSNAPLAPLSILYMQTGWMTKSRMVMNGNGYRLARIAKCIEIKMEMEIELTSIDVSSTAMEMCVRVCECVCNVT